MSKYKIVLFDFDGVLCCDRFYARLEAYYPKAHEFVETRVFGPTSDVSDRWMRGELSSDDVNRFISEGTGLDFEMVTKMFLEGVADMRVDVRLLDLAKTLVARDISVGLVTGNMDVFNQITIERHALYDVFPVIVNSCDYGCLKHEQDGRLFDIAMSMLGCGRDYGKSLLIDDSARSRAVFRQKGGHAFAYTEYAAFKHWADSNLGLLDSTPAFDG